MAQLGLCDITPRFKSEQAFHTNDRAWFESDITTPGFNGCDGADERHCALIHEYCDHH